MIPNEVALNKVMQETADAIREKTGKSELIKPVDFATEIKGITAGGGSGESGELVYLQYDKNTESTLVIMLCALTKVKMTQEGMSAGAVITPLMGEFLETTGITLETLAFAVDPEARISNLSGESMGECTIRELLKAGGIGGMSIDIDTLPQLTKEQFYDLNA